MNKFFHDMFDYNKYANNLFINQILRLNIENTKINHLLNHILNAHEIWLSRIQKRVARFSAWENHTNDLLQEINLQLHIETHYYLNTLSVLDFDGIIKYMNTKGETFENTIRDCFTHLLNHSTHHRGQISLLLRQLNIDPPESDYIFYLRQKN